MSTSASDSTLNGRLFDGRSTRPSKVDLRVDNGQLCASGDAEQCWPLDALRISERLGSAQRRIELPDGAFVEVADSAAWDALPQAWGNSGSQIAWMESRWHWALISLVGIVATCWALYVYALPWAADRVAEQIPTEWVTKLSSNSFAILERIYAEPSQLPEARQRALSARFAALQSAEPGGKPVYTLHFRKSRMGPNAFALPSGDIMMTDELVALADNDDEIIGVLAHELGHVQQRHGLRQTLRGAIVALGSILLLGDMSDVTGLAGTLLQLKYSREFETEADDYAIRMLRANRIDPAHLGTILEKLSQAGEEEEAQSDPETAPDELEQPAEDNAQSGSLTDWLSTHPATEERIRRLKEAGNKAP